MEAAAQRRAQQKEKDRQRRASRQAEEKARLAKITAFQTARAKKRQEAAARLQEEEDKRRKDLKNRTGRAQGRTRLTPKRGARKLKKSASPAPTGDQSKTLARPASAGNLIGPAAPPLTTKQAWTNSTNTNTNTHTSKARQIASKLMAKRAAVPANFHHSVRVLPAGMCHWVVGCTLQADAKVKDARPPPRNSSPAKANDATQTPRHSSSPAKVQWTEHEVGSG